MKIKENKNVVAVCIVLMVVFIVICFSTSIQGESRRFRVTPEITLPEYRTDTGRAIDAYENIMNRFINMTERNLIDINNDVKDIANTLVVIDQRLAEMSTRMMRIEEALDIQQPKKLVENFSQPTTYNNTNDPDSQGQK